MSRPANCFMVFCKSNRKITQLEYPDLSSSEISVILGAKWREMNDSQKESYKVLAEKNRKVCLSSLCCFSLY